MSGGWVGEDGPEVTVPLAGAYVIPVGPMGASGGTLVLDGVTYDVTPRTTPDPDPDPDPDPPPSGRIRSVWHHGWSGPSLSSWPADVRSSLSCVTLAMAQSAGRGTGKLTTPPGASKSEVRALVSGGVDVLVGVGGSGDGGITVTNSTQVDQVVASALTIASALGTTGICWDLEGAPGSGWSTSAVIDASQRLIAAGQKVSIWSALYGGRLAAWGAVAQALGKDFGWWERGFYDFGEAGDSRLTGIVTGDLASMRKYVSRDDQLVASFAPVGSTSRTSTSVMTAAYAAARAKYATAGFSVWEDYQDARAGWSSTRALAAVA